MFKTVSAAQDPSLQLTEYDTWARVVAEIKWRWKKAHKKKAFKVREVVKYHFSELLLIKSGKRLDVNGTRWWTVGEIKGESEKRWRKKFKKGQGERRQSGMVCCQKENASGDVSHTESFRSNAYVGEYEPRRKLPQVFCTKTRSHKYHKPWHFGASPLLFPHSEASTISRLYDTQSFWVYLSNFLQWRPFYTEGELLQGVQNY